MDKKVILAVAGSGKTTHIVKNLSHGKRTLVVTYTINNYENLRKRITDRFGNRWPANVTLMTYFSFLYKFCYKPFCADKVKARGILFSQKFVSEEQERKRKQNKNMRQESYYMTSGKYFYNNRLAFYINNHIIDEVKARIEKYFDEFVIDEVQDIAGRDFTFLENLMATDVNMLFVGDFYQHTFDTSRDGNANKALFEDKVKYERRFASKGFISDNETLVKSWRCSSNVCGYIRENLKIAIYSNRSDTDNTHVELIADANQISSILNDRQVIKLHYKNSSRFGSGHKNWGASKGEDCYNDVCVLLNKETENKRKIGKLDELSQSTKNRLYVAITRARGNVYLIDETQLLKQ